MQLPGKIEKHFVHEKKKSVQGTFARFRIQNYVHVHQGMEAEKIVNRYNCILHPW